MVITVMLEMLLNSSVLQSLAGSSQVQLWDSAVPITEFATAARDKWISVPSELFAFEADPAKASSDPGYYGREYIFKGDVVIENTKLWLIFSSSQGTVSLFSKSGPSTNATNSSSSQVLQLTPRIGSTQAHGIRRYDVLRNAGDEVMVQATFVSGSDPESSATFSVGRTEIVEILPSEKMRELTLRTPIEYAIVPGFIGDDLIFGSKEFATTNVLTLPTEQVLVGLLTGQNHQLVMTWPKGSQQLQVRAMQNPSGKAQEDSIHFQTDGQPLYVAALTAPGIWHRESFKPTHLEKDVRSEWKRPFEARWKTQLTEATVRTTFAFRESKGTIWRGVPGSYDYPVWFDGDATFFHMSKKVPPKGESVIYSLEGQNTPAAILTPVDVIKATFGRSASASLLDIAGQKLRTHHRRGGDGVHRACTCGCTEAIQTFFEAGQETVKKAEIEDALNDMIFFVSCHVDRIEEYRTFASRVLELLKKQKVSVPDLKPFWEELESAAQQIHQEYDVQKENMKSLDHAMVLMRQTMALTDQKSPANVKAYMELLKAWRAMGGAQDYVVAQCHMITRDLFQRAGYGCVSQPQAIPAAQEIRALCRRVLRNPDGYEIWANY